MSRVYLVKFRETVVYDYYVDAHSKEEAEERFREEYNDGGSDDWSKCDIVEQDVYIYE